MGLRRRRKCRWRGLGGCGRGEDGVGGWVGIGLLSLFSIWEGGMV